MKLEFVASINVTLAAALKLASHYIDHTHGALCMSK